jgi:hypothetical protein
VVHRAVVVAVNVALKAPAGTMTEDGTVAIVVLLLERVTVIPPDGAGPVSETVPATGLPPVTDAGLSETAERTEGVTQLGSTQANERPGLDPATPSARPPRMSNPLKSRAAPVRRWKATGA